LYDLVVDSGVPEPKNSITGIAAMISSTRKGVSAGHVHTSQPCNAFYPVRVKGDLQLLHHTRTARRMRCTNHVKRVNPNIDDMQLAIEDASAIWQFILIVNTDTTEAHALD
jgi:hypothetical protein